jgi:hypothetical protein
VINTGKYATLWFAGMALHPEFNDARGYPLNTDPMFVNEIWEVLNYDNWIVMDNQWDITDIRESDDKITLFFNSSFNMFNLNSDGLVLYIFPDDFGMFRDEDYSLLLHSIPQGTYDLISQMLFDYNKMHNITTIDFDILRQLSTGSGGVLFAFWENLPEEAGGPLYFVLNEEIGDFVAYWDFDTWQPFDINDEVLSNMQFLGVNITGYVGMEEISIQTFIIDDVYLLYVFNPRLGFYLGYSIPENEFYKIQEQFMKFQTDEFRTG